MITDRSQYRYVGGDLANVVVNGGIMPLRSSADKPHLRGEDVAFLLEGAIERRTWWNFSRRYDSSGASISGRTNQNRYTPSSYNQWPFHANLAWSAVQGTLYEANQLQDRLFSNAYTWSYSRYLSAEPTAVPWQTTEPDFDDQPFLWTSQRDPVAFDDYALKIVRPSTLFANLHKAKYGAVRVLRNVTESYQSSDFTWTDEGVASQYAATPFFGYAAYEDADGKHRGFGVPKTAMHDEVLLYSAEAEALKVWFPMRVNGTWQTGDGVNHMESRFAILDLTSRSAPGGISGYSFSASAPAVTKTWMLDIVSSFGWPIYTTEVQAYPTIHCYYEFSFSNTWATVRLNPRTSWQ